MRLKFYSLGVVPLVAVTVGLMWLLTTPDTGPQEAQRLALCGVAVLANVFVLHYHFTNPPHPKFLMLRKRKLAIRAHVIGGSVELTAGVVAMVSPSQMIPAAIGFAGNLLLLGFVFAHALLYQVMMKPTPAQLAEYVQERGRESLIDQRVRQAWIAMAATDLAEHPVSDRDKARVLFDTLDTDGNGSLAPDEIAALADKWGLSPHFIDAFIERHGRDGEIPFDLFFRHLYCVHGLGEQLTTRPREKVSPEQSARAVFDRLDLDGSGSIDPYELRMLLLGWGMPEQEVDRYLHVYDDGDSLISFDEFSTQMRPIWQFGYHVLSRERILV